MRHRTDTINRLPPPRLRIAVEIIDGSSRYVGRIDGRPCISAPSREAAVQALLRRAAEGAVH